ncbi:MULTISPECIES: glycosyltransferase family 4 protein [Bacillus cereus group]|uniref:Glycosyltransferase family 1 protein n=1 Tax=Bacillus thuringiensis subsp. jegathesan TaxID=56955 RepID=A0A9X6QUT7_BACTJ|nr:glycosyltransferase family 4 protein [Bacillus thuringiensis]OUB58485.1 glycosyltransferase family 1 protein [Bacillus thuringiensis serovar jegathesan]
MKVLQVTAVDFTLKKFLMPLIDEMQRNNYEVHTACNCRQVGEKLKNEGYIIHHIPFSRNMNIFSHFKSLLNLIKLLKHEKYDCIHTHTPVASLVARLAAKLAGVPTIVYTAHGFYFHENMSPIVYKAIYTLEKVWGRFFTDYLFFQSIEDYNLAKENNFNHKEKIIHIGNGVSTEIFNPSRYNRGNLRANLGYSSEDIVIAFVGRLVKEKGVQELIDAFQIIKEQGYANVKLMLIGGKVDGDRDTFDVDAYINQLPAVCKSDLQLLGLRDDIPQLLVAADLFTLPSYREGLPRSIIEAMAMENPIVATNIRGCREEVFDNKNGYLCERANAKDLAEKLIRIISSEKKMDMFSEESRRLFLSEFDEKMVLNKQLNIFDKIRKEKRNV